jgi:hypothetical protein
MFVGRVAAMLVVAAAAGGAQTGAGRTPARTTTAVAGGSVVSAPVSRHRAWMVYAYTDFYFPHHPGDTATLDLLASKRVDRVMNGDPALWRTYNPNVRQVQYRLFWFALTTTKDTAGPSGVGPMDAWLTAHGFAIESAFLHRKGSAAAQANRITWVAHDGDSAAALNPADSGMRAYQASVFDGLVRNGYAGVFYDVFGRGGLARAFASAEGDSIWYRDHLTAALRAERAAYPGSMIVVNTSNYEFPFDSACIVAAGASHLEQTNNPLSANLTPNWTWIDRMVAAGAQSLEFVSTYTWTDKLPASLTGGNSASPMAREKFAEYASYLLVKDTAGIVAFAPDNSWRDSPRDHWLAAWDVDVGQPVGPRAVLANGTDSLGNPYTIWVRHFSSGAVVLLRTNHPTRLKPVSDFGDAAGVSVDIPPGVTRSLDATTGSARPARQLTLRPGEGAILLP